MKTLRRGALLVLGLSAIVGALHLPMFRPWLLRTAGCPFPTSGRTLGVAEAEQLRARTYGPAAGAQPVLARPALGFVLGQDDRARIAAWSRAHHIVCKPDAHGAGERCVDVPRRLLPFAETSDVVGEAGFGYDVQGILVSVQFLARTTSQSEAASVLERRAQQLAEAGPVQRSPWSSLSRPWGQRRVLLAASDFRGEVSVTKLHGAYAVAESYQTLR